MTKVILPFANVGTWWHDKKGQKGVMLRQDVFDWFVDRKCHCRREWLFGHDLSAWQVLFEFADSSQATLFKLTFGGR